MKKIICALCFVFLFDIFSCYLHFDDLIIGLSQICLIISQTLAEDTIKIVFDCVSMEMWGVSLIRWQVKSLSKRFAWMDWRRKLYILPSHSCYIYTTWKSKQVGMGEVLKTSYGWWTNFYEMELIPLDIILLILILVIGLLLTDDINHYMYVFLRCTFSWQFQSFLSISFKTLQKVYYKFSTKC